LQISMRNFRNESTPNFATWAAGTSHTFTRIVQMNMRMRAGCIGRRSSLVARKTSPSGLSFSQKRTLASCVSAVTPRPVAHHLVETRPMQDIQNKRPCTHLVWLICQLRGRGQTNGAGGAAHLLRRYELVSCLAITQHGWLCLRCRWQARSIPRILPSSTWCEDLQSSLGLLSVRCRQEGVVRAEHEPEMAEGAARGRLEGQAKPNGSTYGETNEEHVSSEDLWL